MRRLVLVLLLAGWGVSLLGAYWWGGRGSEVVVAIPEATVKPIDGGSGADGDDGRAALEGEVARLEALLAERNRGMLRLVLERLATSAPETGPSSSARLGEYDYGAMSADELVNLLLAIERGDHDAGGGSGRFYAMDPLARIILLALEIGARGDEGIEALAHVAGRPLPMEGSVDAETLETMRREREFALDGLGELRDAKALEAMVSLGRESELRTRVLGGMKNHLEYLPVESVAPYVDGIREQLELQWRTDPREGRVGDLAALLVFRHGDNRAYWLATDPELLEHHWSGMLNVAKDAHTGEAWRYVAWVAETHPSGNAREIAEHILTEW